MRRSRSLPKQNRDIIGLEHNTVAKLIIRVLGVVAVLSLAACATLKPPILQVERLGKERVGITGATLNVQFSVRNPNPDPIVIERIEYELRLNGSLLGRGFVSDPTPVAGFGSARVMSRFDLSFLRVPGAIRAILERDRVRARVRGDFYVRQGADQRPKKLRFDNDADVDFRR